MKIDRLLVSRVVAGDAKAEEIFYSTLHPQLLRASRYYLGYYDPDIEDMVQETYIVALGKLKDYTFEAPIYAWLREICRRQCYGYRRSRQRQVASVQEDLELFMQAAAIQRVQEEMDDLSQLDRLALLRQIRQRLGLDSRKIIEMKYVRGLSYATISARLGIPMGTVMSRLARARDQMRSLAEDREYDEHYA